MSGRKFAVVSLFDYAQLDPDLADEARARAARIREFGVQQSEAIIATGRELASVKGSLGHCHFGGWIKAEFSMSADTAERYVRVAAALDGKIRTMRVEADDALRADRQSHSRAGARRNR